MRHQTNELLEKLDMKVMAFFVLFGLLAALLPSPPASAHVLPWRDGELDAVVVGNYANDHHYPGPDWPLAAKRCRWGGRCRSTTRTLKACGRSAWR